MPTLSTIIVVRLTPRAAGDEIAGWRQEQLLARVTAPPVDGRANTALVRLLAGALDLPQSSISITSGATGRTKRVRIEGIEGDEVRRRLDARA